MERTGLETGAAFLGRGGRFDKSTVPPPATAADGAGKQAATWGKRTMRYVPALGAKRKSFFDWGIEQS
jgi:hypothetical protein